VASKDLLLLGAGGAAAGAGVDNILLGDGTSNLLQGDGASVLLIP